MFEYGTIGKSRVPAPKADLTLWLPANKDRRAVISSVIDTGASRTCVPREILEQLGDDIDYQYATIREALGAERQAETCIISLRVGQCVFEDIEVIITDNKYALVGRDILNGYKVILDAPAKSWTASGEGCPA